MAANGAGVVAVVGIAAILIAAWLLHERSKQKRQVVDYRYQGY